MRLLASDSLQVNSLRVAALKVTSVKTVNYRGQNLHVLQLVPKRSALHLRKAFSCL